jgi:hypothetical protein
MLAWIVLPLIPPICYLIGYCHGRRSVSGKLADMSARMLILRARRAANPKTFIHELDVRQ